jgi:hypothetical protein
MRDPCWRSVRARSGWQLGSPGQVLLAGLHDCAAQILPAGQYAHAAVLLARLVDD